MSGDARLRTGSCLCAAVSFEVSGPLRPVVACHCTQCRKTSGHFVAATSAPLAALRLVEDGGLAWYRSSAVARRGFCAICGASLFWQRDDDDRISIMAGTLDRPTGLAIGHHIFCADAGDYYEISDGAPCFPGDDGD